MTSPRSSPRAWLLPLAWLRPLLIALSLAALATACAGGSATSASASDGGCRDHDECDAAKDEGCAPPGAELCGSCTTPQDQCDDMTPCADGLLCVATPLACPCTLATENRCLPACVDDSPCADLERCDLESGRCVARDCDHGDACPDYHQCSIGACIRRSCDKDDECEGGACVLGACYAGAGACSGPAA